MCVDAAAGDEDSVPPGEMLVSGFVTDSVVYFEVSVTVESEVDKLVSVVEGELACAGELVNVVETLQSVKVLVSISFGVLVIFVAVGMTDLLTTFVSVDTGGGSSQLVYVETVLF